MLVPQRLNWRNLLSVSSKRSYQISNTDQTTFSLSWNSSKCNSHQHIIKETNAKQHFLMENNLQESSQVTHPLVEGTNKTGRASMEVKLAIQNQETISLLMQKLAGISIATPPLWIVSTQLAGNPWRQSVQARQWPPSISWVIIFRKEMRSISISWDVCMSSFLDVESSSLKENALLFFCSNWILAFKWIW